MRISGGGSLLVGRDEELAELHAGLEDAARGRGGLILIRGDPGIGKTALLEAAVERARSGGISECWGRCWEGGGVAPYWPWAQVLSSCAARADSATLADWLGPTGPEVAQMAPDLAGRFPGLAGATPSEAPDARLRQFTAVGTFLKTAAAAHGGLLLLLDDLHAADEASLLLLAHLARGLANSHLLVLGAYRSAEVESSARLKRLLASAGAHGQSLTLSGLDEGSVQTLLEHITRGLVPRAVARRVQQATDGNPFFVGQDARFASEGRRDRQRSLEVPEAAQALVRGPVEELDDATRELLAHASVLGREFDLRVLAHVSMSATDSVLDAMAEAEARGFVIETGLGRWSFSHALVREAFDGQLEPSGRAALHRRAGEALEVLGEADLTPQYATLANHFFAAAPEGNLEKAVEYCTLAGEHAMSVLGFEEAARSFANGLEVLARASQPDHRRHYELLMSRARALFRSGELSEARKVHERAFRLAKSLGSGELLARAALGSAGYRSGTEASVRLLREALTALPEEDSPLRAQVLLALAGALTTRSRVPQRWREVSDEGLAMVRRTGTTGVLCRALLLWHRLQVDLDPESLEARLAAVEEAIPLALEADDRESLFWARVWRVGDRFEAGDIRSATDELDRAAQEAFELRLPYLVYAVRLQQATLATFAGELAQGEHLVGEALAAGEPTGSVDAEAIFACQLVGIRRQQGRFAEEAELARRSEERLGLSGGMHFWALWQARALAELGRVSEARAVLTPAFPGARVPETLSGSPRINCAADLTEVCWALKEPGPASDLFELLSPFADRHLVQDVAVRSLGSSNRYLGQLTALLRQWKEADAHFEAAHRHHRRLGTPLWLAHGQADHGRALLARGSPSDRARAEPLLREALEGYQILGMELYQRRVEALLDEITVEARVERARLRQEGDLWAVEYQGSVAWLSDSKGLRYLAALVHRPGQEVDAVDLVEGDSGSSGPERVRLRVTKSVRATIDRLTRTHPLLGEHLRRTVRTGHRLSYVPDARTAVMWTSE